MDLSKMKPPITSAQAMSHPAVFETVNSLGKMADELRAEVEALTKERDVLTERVKALEADAERYRWLKPRLLGADFDWNEEGNCVLVFEMPNDATVSANCDETIDAAIKGARQAGVQ